MQDRDAARPLASPASPRFHRIWLVWADGGYAGELVTWASTRLPVHQQIVKRSDNATGFKVLPRRWGRRTHPGLDHPPPTVRRARDYERLQRHHETMVRWSMIRITSRRLARMQV